MDLFYAIVQSFSDTLWNEKVGSVIILCGALVYQHKLISVIILDKSAGGIYGQRGSADDEDIAVFDSFDGGIYRFLVESLLIKHHVGL